MEIFVGADICAFKFHARAEVDGKSFFILRITHTAIDMKQFIVWTWNVLNFTQRKAPLRWDSFKICIFHVWFKSYIFCQTALMNKRGWLILVNDDWVGQALLVSNILTKGLLSAWFHPLSTWQALEAYEREWAFLAGKETKAQSAFGIWFIRPLDSNLVAGYCETTTKILLVSNQVVALAVRCQGHPRE